MASKRRFTESQEPPSAHGGKRVPRQFPINAPGLVTRSGQKSGKLLRDISVDAEQMSASVLSKLAKKTEFVIPNEVCEVRNLSFLGILIKEGFLASLGMTAIRILQRPVRWSSRVR